VRWQSAIVRKRLGPLFARAADVERWPSAAAIAAAGAAAIAWFGPPGVDLAAHVYQRAIFLQHGFQLWDNYWYAGRYSFISYSLVYYPLAAVLGIKLLAVLTAAASAGAFAVLVRREWPDAGPWPARAFTAVAALTVLTGAFPYALGFACALGALVALRPLRIVPFAVLAALSFAASPLAFVFLLVVLCAVGAMSRLRQLVAPGITVIVIALVGATLQRLFPAGGLFPFPSSELVALLAFCCVGIFLTARVPAARLLLRFFVIYGLVSVAAFVVPTSIGENIARLRFVALPLAALVLALRHWRPALPAAFVLLLAAAWNISPLALAAARQSADPSATAAYWEPAISYLKPRLGHSYRVEAVDTRGHWEAAYLPQAGIPIVRGWFRQDDFPADSLLYHPLRAGQYLTWLRQLAVKYVVLTGAPPDYSSVHEVALLNSAPAGLRLVWQTASIRIFEVAHPAGIVTGAPGAHVVAFDSTSATLALPRPGAYRLSLRFSPYWAPSRGCLRPVPNGLMSLDTRRGGIVTLRFAVTAEHLLDAGTGTTAVCGKRK
jgi:hypothetical protein